MVGGIPFPTPLSMVEFGLTCACPAFVSLLEGGSEHPLHNKYSFIMTHNKFEAPLTVLNVREANQASIFLLKLTAHLA